MVSLPDKPKPKSLSHSSHHRGSLRETSLHTKGHTGCPRCHGSHQLYKCPDFLSLPMDKRSATVQRLKLCLNCLGEDHFVKSYSSRRSCKECGKRHNTLLHKILNKLIMPTGTQASAQASTASPLQQQSSQSLLTSSPNETSLLMTCQVAVESDSRRVQYGRAILDLGSTLTLVTSRFAKCLRAKMNPSFISINAVGQTTPQHSKSTVSLTLRSIHNDMVSVNCQAAVVDRITCDIPEKKFVGIRSTPFLKDLELADPEFDCPGRIDLLLGGTLCQQIILGEKRCTDDKRLYARDTIFVWTITGEWDVSSRNAMVNVCLRSSAIDQQTHQVERFWKIEDVPSPNLHLSLGDSQAVDHFKDTHSRDNDGRYIVRLPRHQPPLELGCSRDQAVRRFQQNYKSLDKKGKWEQFRDAVDEYATLQHAEEVTAASLTKAEAECFYMPMHGVTK